MKISWIVFIFFFKEGEKQKNIESVIMTIPANLNIFGELKKIDNLLRRDHTAGFIYNLLVNDYATSFKVPMQFDHFRP